MAENKGTTLNSIQMLRGIAAFAVMLVHHQQYLPLPINAPLSKVIPGAGWGVDLFFIISGFIAAYTVPISDFGVKAGANYLMRRCIRVIPLYYILTLLSFGSDATAWENSIKSMLFIPVGGGEGPLYGGAKIGQGWTLNYEIYFYFIVALSFVAGKYKWLLTIALITSTILSAAIFNPLPQHYLLNGFTFSNTYLSMITNPVIFEFLAGVLLGLYYPKVSRLISSLDIALCLGAIGIFMYNACAQVWVGHGLQGWGWPSFLLLASVVKLEKCGLSFSNKTLLSLGACSYSVYLLHENIKNIFIKISKHASDIFVMPHCMLLILSISTTLIVAGYTHRFIEVKLSIWLKDKLFQRKQLVTSEIK